MNWAEKGEGFSMSEVRILEGFWGHVAELTKRMKTVLVVFIVSLMVALILPANTDFFALTNNYKPLVSVLLTGIAKMYLPPDVSLFAVSMSDPISIYVYIALVFAIGVTLPFFAYQAYKFINPALYPHERRAIFPFITIVSLLFVAGALFGFFFLVPAFIQGFFPFYVAVNAVKLFPLMDFYSLVLFSILISGILFTFPAFFVMLVKFHIIGTKTFTKQRKYIYAALIVAALLISPGATPQGDLYLFLMLVVLVEGSFLVGRRYEKQLKTTSDSQSLLSKWFSPVGRCKYCDSKVPENSRHCPSCKRFLT